MSDTTHEQDGSVAQPSFTSPAELRRYVYRTSIKPGLSEGWYFRLHPRKPIFLFSPDRDGSRFARLFRETWQRLPLWSRRSILKYWREGSPPDFTLKPNIELLDDWSVRERGKGLRGEKAGTYRAGNALRFWSRIVDAYPDPLVRDLIAHELAHVCRYSQGYRDIRGADGKWVCIKASGRRLDTMEVEEDADWLMSCWGFEPNAIDEWDREHGISKVYHWEQMSDSERRRFFERLLERGR
jgi:hypothetical protein